MFFLLSKTLGNLIIPSNAIVAVAVLGLILFPTRLARWGQRLLVVGWLLLIVCSLSPLPYLALVPLEARFPRWDGAGPAPSGIIVLGGAIDPALSLAHEAPIFTAGVDRLIAASQLVRRFPHVRIVFTGGSGEMFSDAREADWANSAFEALGVAADRITLERTARNTYENATFTKNLLGPDARGKWVLVTSAFHMPRAVAVFRAAGFDVQPLPVGWKTLGTEGILTFPGFNLGALGLLDLATKEWIGLAAYRLTGRTTEFFPAP